ncbi:MAG: hypothetical protein ACR2ND_15615 [Solirubrobacteraceae bacterium]
MNVAVAPFALAGGSLIFGALLVIFFAIAYGFYSRRGSAINQHPQGARVARGEKLDDVSRAVQAYPTYAEGAARAADQHITARYSSIRVRALTRLILATLRVLELAR